MASKEKMNKPIRIFILYMICLLLCYHSVLVWMICKKTYLHIRGLVNIKISPTNFRFWVLTTFTPVLEIMHFSSNLAKNDQRLIIELQYNTCGLKQPYFGKFSARSQTLSFWPSSSSIIVSCYWFQLISNDRNLFHKIRLFFSLLILI